MTEQELIITTAKDILLKLMDRFEPVDLEAPGILGDEVLADAGRRLTLLARQVKGTMAEISVSK